MNRIVLFGLTAFFSLVGIGLLGESRSAKAFHGTHLYGGFQADQTTSGGLLHYTGVAHYASAVTLKLAWQSGKMLHDMSKFYRSTFNTLLSV